MYRVSYLALIKVTYSQHLEVSAISNHLISLCCGKAVLSHFFLFPDTTFCRVLSFRPCQGLPLILSFPSSFPRLEWYQEPLLTAADMGRRRLLRVMTLLSHLQFFPYSYLYPPQPGYSRGALSLSFGITGRHGSFIPGDQLLQSLLHRPSSLPPSPLPFPTTIHHQQLLRSSREGCHHFHLSP